MYIRLGTKVYGPNEVDTAMNIMGAYHHKIRHICDKSRCNNSIVFVPDKEVVSEFDGIVELIEKNKELQDVD